MTVFAMPTFFALLSDRKVLLNADSRRLTDRSRLGRFVNC